MTEAPVSHGLFSGLTWCRGLISKTMVSRLCILAAYFVVAPTLASAELIRNVVVVTRPNLPRRAADAAIAGLARKAFLEALINQRMSPVLLSTRGEEIRSAFEPIDALLSKFTVISQLDKDTATVSVTCEAEVDFGQVLVRLVSAKVLSFAEDPPRVLIVPAGQTSDTAVKAIRARLASGLGAAGFTILASEATAAVQVTKWRSSEEGQAWMKRTVTETRADLIAMVSVIASRAPSSVGGVVLDTEIQYTVFRPTDNAIVAEKAFQTRGSGATVLLAEQSILQELGPQMAADLSGQLVTEVFGGGNVIDGSGSLSGTVTLNVFFRPDASATAQLKAFLEAKGLKVELGNSSLATIESEIRNRVADPGFDGKKVTPADRLIVSGDTSVSRLYDLLSTEAVNAQKLKASVIEYGDNYIGLELTLPAAPQRVTPVSKKPVEPTVGPAAASPQARVRPPLVFKKKLKG